MDKTGKKIFLLSDPNLPHTLKWVEGISPFVDEIYLYGLSELVTDAYQNLGNVTVYSAGFSRSTLRRNSGSFSKIFYLKVVPEVRKLLKELKPDILHSHFATSYGMIGMLSGFHPFVLSVWGEDVYKFPARSVFHKNLFRMILASADRLLSTGEVMAREIGKYTRKKIGITPFGIDTDKYRKMEIDSFFDLGNIVIGILKPLEKTYGIDTLIDAFAELNTRYANIRLLIVGGGAEENNLKKSVEIFRIGDKVRFTGRVPYHKTPVYHNMIDIGVYPSLYESFGVAVLEASACELPVVVSATGGLKEVVIEGETGLFAEPGNKIDLAEKIELLLEDEKLRTLLGKNGRAMVLDKYRFADNLEIMLGIYREITEETSSL